MVGSFKGTIDFDFGSGITELTSSNTAIRDLFMMKLSTCTPSMGTDVITACDSLVWIDGITYTADNSTAIYTLNNGASDGCDSIVHLNLSIVYPTTGVDVIVACDSLIWLDGITYYANNSTAIDTLINSVGCDSIVSLNLTIANTFSTDSQTACDSLLWIDGITYYSDNTTATHILTNITGCDSTVTLNLDIINSNQIVTVTGLTLSVVPQTGAIYQWLDCDIGYAQIQGATVSTYTVIIDGEYAVEISYSGCVDTTNCMDVTGVGLNETDPFFKFTIFPNPTKGIVNINSKRSK